MFEVAFSSNIARSYELQNGEKRAPIVHHELVGMTSVSAYLILLKLKSLLDKPRSTSTDRITGVRFHLIAGSGRYSSKF